MKTPLYDAHLRCGGKIVDFAGWQLPIHYGSQMDEHHVVRQHAGMFDVSHMTVLDLRGDQVKAFLQRLLANNVDKLKQQGKAIYSCMLNENAGIIDDLIVYYMEDAWYRMVVNAATRDKDIQWISKQATPFGIDIHERDDLAMIAVQGPQARDCVHQVLADFRQQLEALVPFSAAVAGNCFVGRTGYTGEDGYEIMIGGAEAGTLWQKLLDAGVKPCGLGARDTLRLEAGMNLYGTDMDENYTPLDSGLSWTVAWEPADRDFIGRTVLEKQKQEGPRYRFVGLILEERGVLRGHQQVFIDGQAAGEITSGSFSPTLKQSVAMARLSIAEGDKCTVDIRGKQLPARIVKPVFVRQGKAVSNNK